MYNTMTLAQIWKTNSEFVNDFNDSFAAGSIKNPELLGNLLYAEYGNSPIAFSDVNLFKANVWSTIFKFGPTWEKRLEIQDKLRNISEDELRVGSKAINNTAVNPTQRQTTSGLEEVTEITQQTATNFKKSKLDAYAQLNDLLESDVTGEFIKQFKKCFKQFVMPENVVLYEDEE